MEPEKGRMHVRLLVPSLLRPGWQQVCNFSREARSLGFYTSAPSSSKLNLQSANHYTTEPTKMFDLHSNLKTKTKKQ